MPNRFSLHRPAKEEPPLGDRATLPVALLERDTTAPADTDTGGDPLDGPTGETDDAATDAGGEAAGADPAPGQSARTKPARPPRLVSLDAFRGLTIVGMLLVNNISLGGQTPAALLHAEWSGQVHLADLVFPWFLFIVGVALPYAVASARRKHLPTLQFDLKALWRAASLVGLGCLIDSFLSHRIVFDLGVLQIIGLAYFMTVLVGGLFGLRGRLVMAGVVLLAHWLLLKLVPVPGVGAGVFTEQSNVPQYVNKAFLARLHLSGLLSVIPTTGMVLIGTAVGDLLRRKKISAWAKVGVLVVCGMGLLAGGYIGSLHAFSEFTLPMNKPVWTPPYILWCAGWACLTLAGMYALVDMTPGKTGAKVAAPLLVFGSNAIVAYVAPILTKVAILRNIQTTWPTGHTLNLEDALHEYFYQSFGRINGGWAYTFAYIAVWWCVLLVLYRKKWFLRV